MTSANNIESSSNTLGTVRVPPSSSPTYMHRRPSVFSTQGSDQASLSTASGAVSSSLSTPDVRTTLVAALRQVIGSGTYHIAAGDVASKLMTAMFA